MAKKEINAIKEAAADDKQLHKFLELYALLLE
jgi:hypothetical protein